MISKTARKPELLLVQNRKAVEDAVMLVHDYNASPEFAAQKMKAPLELVLEALEK